MTRTLLIIAGAALVLCLACRGGPAALGGRDMARNGWAWTLQEGDGDSVRFERVNGARTVGPDVTRNLTWDGQDSLRIEDSLNVTFIQGAQAGVVVTGPQDAVDRVVVTGGRISLKDGNERVTFGFRPGGAEIWADSERVRITVTAPAVSRFAVEGSGELDIQNYDRDDLRVDINGSGEVTAIGKARRLALSINGSGDADLAALTLTDADVDITGSGEARVGPTGDADITINGSGDVTLTERPAKVSRTISGSGGIDESF
jgi:hypothetical protein